MTVQPHLLIRTLAGPLCAALSAVALVLGAGAPAMAQGDPVEFGAGQQPFIMILMDTSASMQWTEAGDEAYPRHEGALAPNLADWRAGSPLNFSAAGLQQNGSPTTVGPCATWADSCDNYKRPAWCASPDCPWLGNYPSTMVQRLSEMRLNNLTMRMKNASGQGAALVYSSKPRHVQLKEILTGDMVLLNTTDPNAIRNADIESYDPNLYGPGCFFVPRMATATREEQVCAANNTKFRALADADDPRPHIQEVFDGQKKNGLMDIVGGSAVFGIAMFDGYSDARFDDALQVADPALTGCRDSAGNNKLCYNMGTTRAVLPRKFDLTSSTLQSVTSFTQLALIDAGYMQTAMDATYTVDPNRTQTGTSAGNRWPPVSFPQGFQNVMDPYRLGKQPMARATPLAAAVHDLHRLFKGGQRSIDGVLPASNPVMTDPYRLCRAKHVIMLTDGYPEPEAPGGAGRELGSDILMFGSHGYDDLLYKYPVTEQAIASLVGDDSLYDSANRSEKTRYWTRAHIMGVNVNLEGTRKSDVLDKMATMAMMGQTCAQYFLPPEFIPVGFRSGRIDETTGSADGTCNPALGQTCLMLQNKPFVYTPPDPEAEDFQCHHPALILTDNNPEKIRKAFSFIFNEILGSAGLASRTRPAMTSYLDDVSNLGSARRGQYRLYSGMRLDGNNVYWKGLLNREVLACKTDGSGMLDSSEPMRALHDDVNLLRNDHTSNTTEPRRGLIDADRRRLFTMVPSSDTFDYANNVSKTIDNPFVSRLVMTNTTRDEFGTTYVNNPAGTTNAAVVGRRIPFEYETLKLAYTAVAPNGLGMSQDTFLQYFQTYNLDPTLAITNFRNLVHEVRGRIADKSDRVLGPIYNSNPLIVGPPDLDLPIDSYQAYRAAYATRPTMLYVGSFSGQLHAIHTGRPSIRVRPLTKEADAGKTLRDELGEGPKQREAWAYIPHMLHKRLASFRGTQGRLLDGSAVVQDVRLCHEKKRFNTNEQACGLFGETVPGPDQWRTVLVQGLGEAGQGYFALDVTRTGDSRMPPDPIPLWEFDPTWERGQVARLKAGKNASWVLPTVTHAGVDGTTWDYSFMGSSVGDPAIATIVLKPDRDQEDTFQRAVAMFTGGTSQVENLNETAGQPQLRLGKAIYIVDLQSGSLLRRFVEYKNNAGQMVKFDQGIVGTPALYDDFTGSVATRAFVGDAKGRLFRIDLTDPNPHKWEASLFFDPSADTQLMSPFDPVAGYGPAAFKPAVAMGTNRNMVVVYGLGERGDTSTAGQTQAVIAIEERFSSTRVVPSVLWRLVFARGEKLTGEPIVFNGATYFTSYYRADEANACIPGNARIYGLKFEGQPAAANGARNYDPLGVFDRTKFGQDVLVDTDPNHSMAWWFGPLQPTLIRGVSVTMGPNCSVVTDADNKQQLKENDERQPQLVAQSGKADPRSGSYGGNTAPPANSEINPIVQDLERPRSQTIPLSWTLINH